MFKKHIIIIQTKNNERESARAADGIYPDDCGFYCVTGEARKALEPVFRKVCGKT